MPGLTARGVLYLNADAVREAFIDITDFQIPRRPTLRRNPAFWSKCLSNHCLAPIAAQIVIKNWRAQILLHYPQTDALGGQI